MRHSSPATRCARPRLWLVTRVNSRAVIVEPVVQGAGGMHFYAPAVVRRLRELCDRYELPLILDEIGDRVRQNRSTVRL